MVGLFHLNLAGAFVFWEVGDIVDAGLVRSGHHGVWDLATGAVRVTHLEVEKDPDIGKVKLAVLSE